MEKFKASPNSKHKVIFSTPYVPTTSGQARGKKGHGNVAKVWAGPSQAPRELQILLMESNAAYKTGQALKKVVVFVTNLRGVFLWPYSFQAVPLPQVRLSSWLAVWQMVLMTLSWKLLGAFGQQEIVCSSCDTGTQTRGGNKIKLKNQHQKEKKYGKNKKTMLFF